MKERGGHLLNPHARQALQELVAQHGPGLVEDPRRCRALLLDLCSDCRREISVLEAAQQEGIAADLLGLATELPPQVWIAQLTQRLVANRALAEDAARWAVESWAQALGKLPSGEGPPQPESTAGPRPPAAEAATFRSQWRVAVYGRPAGGEGESEWVKLGVTPGRVPYAVNHRLKLIPEVLPEELPAWLAEVRGWAQVSALELASPVTDEALAALSGMTQLQELTLEDCTRLTDAALIALASLRGLETLKLGWATRLTDRGVDVLGQLASLMSLTVTHARLSDAGIAFLTKLASLRSLALRECGRLSGLGLVALSAVSHLVALDLAGGSQISDAGLGAIAALTGLEKLDLSHCPRITVRGVARLEALEHLLHLNLAWNPLIDDGAMEAVAPLSSLATLILGHTRITDAGLAHLSALKELVYLDLSGCDGITDRGLGTLGALTGLAVVNLQGCARLTPRGLGALQRAGLTIVR